MPMIPSSSSSMNFPKKIRPSHHLFDIPRKQRTRALATASLRACFIRLTLIAIEMVGYYATGSQSLLLDALASSYDLVTSLALLSCLWIAQTPPDKKHPFGHGRLEPIAGMQMALFLVFFGAYLLYQEVSWFLQPPVSQAHPIAAYSGLFALLATILMELSYRHLIHQAKRHESRAMETEALHYRLDAANSLLATFVLFCAALFPSISHYLDHVGAAIIALMMGISGFKAAKRNLDQLLDARPDNVHFARIKKAAMQVEGVKDTEKIAIQQYGPDAHVDIDIEVLPDLRVDVAHEISQKVRVAIQECWPSVQNVTVHIEPYYPGDH